MTSAETSAGLLRPRAALAGVLFVSLLSCALGVAIATNAWLVVAGVVTLVGMSVVLTVPRQAIVLSIALSASELVVPEPSGQLRVFVLGIVAAIAWRAINGFWNDTSEPWTVSRTMVLAFAVWTLAVMAVRGVGFQALGGTKAGGFLYVRLLAAAGFALYLPGVRLAVAQWRRALLAMCLLGALPLAADLTALYVRGLAPSAASLFHLSPSVEGAVFGTTTDGGAFRWFSAMSLSTYITLFVFFTERRDDLPERVSANVITGLLFAFAIASFSGHRLAIVNVLGISTLVLLMDGRLTLRRAIGGVVILAVVLAMLSAVAASLPVAVQRSISWVPGITVAAEASRSATDSLTWRLAVWLVALQEIPKYLWIGRGLAFDRGDASAVLSAHVMSGEANWAIVEGYFHNGWLSLLILFGIAGLVIGFALLTAVSFRHTRITRMAWVNPQLQRYHRVITAWVLLQVISYWFIYGDVQVSFPQILFGAAILDALRSDDLAGNSGNASPVASLAGLT